MPRPRQDRDVGVTISRQNRDVQKDASRLSSDRDSLETETFMTTTITVKDYLCYLQVAKRDDDLADAVLLNSVEKDKN